MPPVLSECLGHSLMGSRSFFHPVYPSVRSFMHPANSPLCRIYHTWATTNARASKPSVAALCSIQCRCFFQNHLDYRGDHQLRNTLTAPHREGHITPIDQQHF